MATGDTYSDIGGTRYVSAAKPATADQLGYGALTWTALQGVISWPDRGDMRSDVGEPTLDNGRKEYLGGLVDGGQYDVTIKHIEDDAGQAIIAANADGVTEVSIQDVDQDGVATFFYGVILGWRRREKSTSSQKAYIMTIGVNSATFEGTEEAP